MSDGSNCILIGQRTVVLEAAVPSYMLSAVWTGMPGSCCVGGRGGGPANVVIIALALHEW